VKFLLISLLFASQAYACETPDQNLPRGYVSRACGLDLDHDGIWGEEEDCNKLCRGATPAETLTVSGQSVRQYAVPQKYATVTQAISAINDTDQIQDVVCVHGTYKETIAPKNGIAKTFVRAKRGSESFDFTYPAAPLLVLGADYDGDGNYPPFDKDDVADFDGTNLQSWINPVTAKNNFEAAHIRVKYYGAYTPTMPIDGVNTVKGMGSKTWYLHDIEMTDIHRGMPKMSNNHIFAGWSERVAENFAVENVQCLNCAGYIQRGSHGKLRTRFSHLYMTSLPGNCNGNPSCANDGGHDRQAPLAFKIWGQVDYYEVIDSILDANLKAYASLVYGSGGGAFGFNDNAQYIYLKNNKLIDYNNLFNSQPNADDSSLSCKGRFADHMFVESNELITNYCIGGPNRACAAGCSVCIKGSRGVILDPGDPWGWGRNYTFKNNKITVSDLAGATKFPSSTSCMELSNIAVVATDSQKALCPSQTITSCDQAFPGSVIEVSGNTCNLPTNKVIIDGRKVESEFSGQTQCSFKQWGTYKIQSTW
jgi:hypothetical protein